MENSELIRTLLTKTRSIALVGASPKPQRPSHTVMAYLLAAGYSVYPVNPTCAGSEILGQRVYAQLADIPDPIDLVDVFREASAAPALVDEALAIGAKAFWLQLGLSSPQAREKAKSAGLPYIENLCIKIEHRQLG